MKKEHTERLNLMVPPTYMEGLDKLAKRDLSNRSVEVRQAIRRHLMLKGISVDDNNPSGFPSRE